MSRRLTDSFDVTIIVSNHHENLEPGHNHRSQQLA